MLLLNEISLCKSPATSKTQKTQTEGIDTKGLLPPRVTDTCNLTGDEVVKDKVL